jgi:hypothetical protein
MYPFPKFQSPQWCIKSIFHHISLISLLTPSSFMILSDYFLSNIDNLWNIPLQIQMICKNILSSISILFCCVIYYIHRHQGWGHSLHTVSLFFYHNELLPRMTTGQLELWYNPIYHLLCKSALLKFSLHSGAILLLWSRCLFHSYMQTIFS